MSKILIDGLCYYKNSGEYGEYVRTIIDKLSKLKIKKVSITSDSNKELKINNIRVINKNINRLTELSPYKTDIFHCFNNGFYIDENSDFKNIMSVSTILSIINPSFVSEKYLNRYTERFSSSLSKADIVIVSSNMQKNKLLDYYKITDDKVRVIYPTIREIFEVKNNRHSKSYINFKFNIENRFLLSVFDLHRKKDIEEVIYFFAHIKNTLHISDKLVIVTKNVHFNDYEKEYLNDLKILAENLSIENDVKFLSDISTLDEFHLFNMAHKYIDLSINDDFNLNILKAFISDVDIICANSILNKELLGEFPFYYSFIEEDIIDIYLRERNEFESEKFDFLRDRYKGNLGANQLKQIYLELGGFL